MIGIFLRWLRIDQWPDRHFLFWYHFLEENFEGHRFARQGGDLWTPKYMTYIYTVYIHIYVYAYI